MYRFVLLGALFVLGACSQVAPPQANEVVDTQLTANGVKGDGVEVAVSQKLGAVFVVGSTEGALDGPHKGEEDVFLRRYHRNGTLAWRTQIGGALQNSPRGVALDRNNNVYVLTYTSRIGDSGIGNLYKYSSGGKQLWVRRLGTPPQAGGDVYFNRLVVASNGNVYIAGSYPLDETFLRAYNASGTLLYETSFVGDDMGEDVTALTTDAAGNAYMATRVITDEEYYTSIIHKFSPSGKQLWSRVTPGETQIFSLQVVSNTLWGGGTKYYLGSLSNGHYGVIEEDAYIATYDLSGTLNWSKSFGTRRTDGVGGISADSQGNVFVVGQTLGSLGAPNKGQGDIFVRKFTSSGNAVWTKQVGTAGYDSADIAAYSANELYLTGSTDGTFPNGTYNSGVLTMRLDGGGRTVWLDQ